MSSILNENEEDTGRTPNYLSGGGGGLDDDQRRQRRTSLKSNLFKLVNLITFHNAITSTAFIILLMIEFTQFLGFILFKLNVASTTVSAYADAGTGSNSTSSIASAKATHLAAVSYVNFMQVLMMIREGIASDETKGMTVSYVIGGLASFITCINLIIITVLCKYAKDGYDALFASPLTKMLLKICGVIQMSFLKVFFLPLLTILISIVICSKDLSLTKPGLVISENSAQSTSPLGSGENSQTSGSDASFNSQEDVFRSYFYGGYQCWTIPHIVLTIICMFFALLMSGLTLLQSLLFNDIRFHSILPWGASATKGCFLKTILKILIAISLNIEMYNRWAMVVCQSGNVIIVYLLLHQRWNYFYFHDRKIMVVTILQESGYLWLSFVVTLINAAELETLSFSLFSYLIISSIAFAILVLTVFLNSKDSHYMLFKLPHLRQDYEFEQFFIRLQRHVQDSKTNNIDKIVVYGLIKDHQRNALSRCTDPKCHCEQLFYLMSKNKLQKHLEQLHEMAIEKQRLLNKEESKYNFDKVEKIKMDLENKQIKRYEHKFRRLFFKFFYSLLTKRIDNQFPKSMRLKFLQVQVLQHELSNEFKSYFQILKLLRDKPSLEFQYFLYQSKQNVEHIMYRKYQTLLNNKQTIDVMKVYEFEQLFLHFEKHIINTANNCLNFWKELMDKRLDVNRIHDFGVQISNSYSEVNDITQRMISLFPHHVMFQRIYAGFLGDVMNNENEAYEINSRVKAYLESSNNMHKLNYMNEDKFFGYNTGTVIIVMTVTSRDIGNIVNANYETKNLFGYRHKELKGKNLRMLMPKILSDNHDGFIQNYFDTAKAKILEQQRVIWGKDKEGYLVPCDLLVKSIPNLKKNLTFVGFMKRLTDDNPMLQPPSQYSQNEVHLIMTDFSGAIYGFTENCWETFGFKPSFFMNQFGDPEQQSKIEQLVPNLSDLYKNSHEEMKREGVFCALETQVVMENAPRELLSKEDHDLMRNISGKYNINLQVEQILYANGKISLKMFKIVRLSRWIKSNNPLDYANQSLNNSGMIGNGIQRPMSLESQEIDSLVEETNQLENFKRLQQTKLGANKKRVNFDEYENPRIGAETPNHDHSGLVDPNDINISGIGPNDSSMRDLNRNGNNSMYDHSDDEGSSNSAGHSQSQQLINFKKQISTKEMPASIIKLNRLVHAIVMVILAVVIFDTAQNYQYYNFSKQCQQILQNLYHKHYLVSKIGSNIINMGLINMGLQNDNFQNFTQRRANLRDKLLKDIETLELMETSIQNSPGQASVGLYSLEGSSSKKFNSNPPLSITLLNSDASLLFDNSQTMRYAVSQLISRVSSLLQLTNSSQTLTLPPELAPLNQKILNNGNPISKDTRNETIKSVYFIVNNALKDLTNVTLQQLDAFQTVAFDRSQELNHWLLVSAFIFFCVFVVMSGFVIFPIVMGVQKNKVMILSIYFDLPMTEIKSVHERCYDFLCRVDDERRNEALMIEAAKENNMIENTLYQAEESKGDHAGTEEAGNDDGNNNSSVDDPNYTKRESARMSNRNLVDSNFKFLRKKNQDGGGEGKGGLTTDKVTTSKIARGGIGKKPSEEEDEQDGVGDPSKKRRDSENSKEGEEDKDDGGLDHNKMLKDIKISNNKLNMITLSVILVFLTYFATCFGVSLSYLSQIKDNVEIDTQLYSEQPALQYTYLYFLTDILLDDQISTEVELQRYSKKIAEVYNLLNAREDAKKKGINWLKEVDNQTFCSTISNYVDTLFEQKQCNYILDGQFRLGYRSNVFSFMYQFQQLRVQYEIDRKNQSQTALLSKIKLLNDIAFQRYSIISNSYYQPQMEGFNAAMKDSLNVFFNKAILFVQLRIIFFVIFTFTIFAFMWRIFLRNIQAEVFRSKGMLNMIPTAFLEKDNNLKKLSLNKLVNLG